MDVFTSVASPKDDGGDDIVVARQLEDSSTLLVVADGATGVGHGRRAAECFVSNCLNQLKAFPVADELLQKLFVSCDQAIQGLNYDCDTTGVVCIIKDGNYACASVGDSGAWLIAADQITEITKFQHRKPRIGSGCRMPSVNRGKAPMPGMLLMGTDGLDYALPLEFAVEIVRSTTRNPAEEITRIASELHHGHLPDDLGVIVCRM